MDTKQAKRKRKEAEKKITRIMRDLKEETGASKVDLTLDTEDITRKDPPRPDQDIVKAIIDLTL
jgi:hypothetical protein